VILPEADAVISQYSFNIKHVSLPNLHNRQLRQQQLRKRYGINIIKVWPWNEVIESQLAKVDIDCKTVTMT
jgi:hypothetical protein